MAIRSTVCNAEEMKIATIRTDGEFSEYSWVMLVKVVGK